MMQALDRLGSYARLMELDKKLRGLRCRTRPTPMLATSMLANATLRASLQPQDSRLGLVLAYIHSREGIGIVGVWH